MNHVAPTPEPLAPGPELERARWIAFRYVIAATVILGAAGILGVIMRDSQAGVDRVPDGWFYAIMTAHGLGAFVGWAAFAVMGFAFWVLAQVGFPLTRTAARLADAAWWLMVLGVAGVVVTCLGFKFGASWVFLYPLSFHGAGQWGRWTSFFFSGSVLLTGLSIVVWCLSILTVVLGPALHAVKRSIPNRVGVAIGLGYLAPRRFATNPRPVPYPVIPLTVIALDMIVATLPLAVLLVEMMVQSLTPSVHVDPLLAKNVLWWFGHPVVYLLLFPAVAMLYQLVPKYAGRPLVAGNVISIGWALAVVVNVIIWAHHIYIDYPSGSPQAAINTAMQPLTFSITIVSALSLYSLFFTIYRSRYRWDAAGAAMFLALVAWLLAGLSGVVNATIAFDQVVHNTLWVVGHFHQMALLMIGFVIFAGVYAWLPDLIGKPLYSDAMGRVHVWLTFVLGTANSALWLWQGLHGAPRRFAVLPHQYDNITQAGVPLAIGLGLTQILFAVNIVQTLRGKGVGRVADPKRSRRVVLVALAGGLALAGGSFGWAAGTEATKAWAGSAASAPAGANPALAAGRSIFTSAGCSGCHTLAAAGAHGTVGPNLDQKKPNLALVIARVTNGGKVMPPFKSSLSATQIQEVAAFVVASEGNG
ncbi:MAG TPA: cbb3-type cytochrome c oxidase subunit I [Candidatus Elarobacter sp.]|nr:cbb3-type cytochrome c oxidase subunit I [Candidatus Elarobacter sp.]